MAIIQRLSGVGVGVVVTTAVGAAVGLFVWVSTNSQIFNLNYASRLTSTGGNSISIGNYYMYLGNASNLAGSSKVDWVRVRKYAATAPAFSSVANEEYVNGSFTLTYTAGANGSISGSSSQSVYSGSSGSAVTAVADSNYHFVNWSDNSTSNPRTDTNVLANLSVTANFAADDITAPVISSIGSTPATNSATITWTTNEISSSKVEYGLNTAYGFVTSESDTSPRVTSHSVSLSGLASCARYYYRVISKDPYTNQANSSQQSFTTTGCTTSSVTGGSESLLALTGGTVSLTNDNSTAQLTVPNNYAAQQATFQINKLDTSNPPSGPSGKSIANNNFYELVAVTTGDQQLSSFNSPVTFTISYGSDTETSFVESTLDVYKYTGSGWEDKNCTLDTTANTITCTLSGFSTYAVLGDPVSSSSASSSTSASSDTSTESQPPACTDLTPIFVPKLFQIDTTSTTATLHFETTKDTTGYQIFYGKSESADEYSDSFDYSGPLWIISRTINRLEPNAKYYFKVRSVNGCSAGTFSPTLSSNPQTSAPVATTPDQIVDNLVTKAEEIKQVVTEKVSEIPVLEKVVEKEIVVQKIETNPKPNIIEYIVQKGDNLWNISKKYFVSLKEIQLPSLPSLPQLPPTPKIAMPQLPSLPTLPELPPAPQLPSLPKIDFRKIVAGMKLKIDLSSLTPEQVKEVAPEISPDTKGYDLDIKVLAMNNEPLRGIKVTLHSTPRDAITDDNGIASFKNVEPGEHKVYLAYGSFNGGGQSINLTGEKSSIELVMQVNLVKSISWQTILISVIVTIALISLFIFFLLKKHYLYLKK